MVLAEQGKWDEILYRLNRNTDNSGGHLGSMYITSPDEAAFPLHAILRHRPTLAVVDSLIHKLSNDGSALPGVLIPEEAREKTLQQTPLHVAVAWGCSVPVLERLLQGDSLVIPAMSKDGLLRFPLHWACAPTTLHNIPRFPWQRQAWADYRYDVIHFLLEQYPVAVVIPDLYQQTPLDYARQHKLPKSVIELLEEVAEDFERYGPKYQANDSPRDLMETTTMVSDSEHFKNTLPDGVLMIDSAEKAPLTWAHWEGDDDVSSLGGDFSHMLVETFGNPTTTATTSPIAHVTRLFSSALSFGSAKSAVDDPNSAATDMLAPVPLTDSTTGVEFYPAGTNSVKVHVPTPESTTNDTSTGVTFYPAKKGVKIKSIKTRTAKMAPIKPTFIQKTSSLSTTEEEEEEESSRREEDVIPMNNVPVRTKTLLKGNIQFKKRSPRKPIATARDDPADSSWTEAEEQDPETIAASPSEEALPWMVA
mmetsp:Transcript_13707/g.26277  ORF Transcript_13707/g.26277 Transcript_13707/m.26277 type:complete len:477 (+) Transcript_13707:2-1432(+)